MFRLCLLLFGLLRTFRSALTAASTVFGIIVFASAAAPVVAAEEPIDGFNPPLPYRIGDVLASPEGPQDPNRPFVRLLVAQFTFPNQHWAIIAPTIEALRTLFGPGNFEARIYSGQAKEAEKADLIIGSTGVYLQAVPYGARALVTVASDLRPDPNEGEGSLFVTLKGSSIHNFEDLRGKRLSVDLLYGFSGFHTALGEISRRGYDVDHFFSSVLPCGHDMRCTLDELRAGRADAVVLRTCFLEEYQALGGRTDDLLPIAVRPETRTGTCLSSTELYPNWTLFSMPRASSEVVRAAVTTLLQLPTLERGIHWGIASNFEEADALYRSIELGPYAYLRTWTLRRFWDEYRIWIVALTLIAIGFIAHSMRTELLVRRRTAALQSSMLEQHRLEARAREAQQRMEALQKAGAIGQISSIVAHELRQPLSSILAYAHGLHRLLERGARPNEQMLESVIEKIEQQAERADLIVTKVRDYAKEKHAVMTRTAIEPIVERAVRMLNESLSFRHTVQLELPKEAKTDQQNSVRHIAVFANAFELELCTANLIKNALQAVENDPAGEVIVRINETEDLVEVFIEDNGPALSTEAFERLARPLNSSKIDGLGLGLSIVRLILESHGGHLLFRKRSPHGLCAVMALPKSPSEEELQNQAAEATSSDENANKSLH